jgi:hypothetical protein
MKVLSVILAGSALTLALSAATGLRYSPADARQLHLRAESVRLRAHFDSVDKELRAADVSHLNDRQRATRAKLIAWLREYREAGRFPENDRFADRAMPFFRDSHGTLCAMAYLIDRSGRGDIVDHIAKTRNNAFIHELVDDPALVAWVGESGLTVDEAARIQPMYGSQPPVIVENKDRVSQNYALLSMGLGGASLGSLGVNLFAPSRTSAGVGLVAGVATIIAGAAHLNESGGNQNVAIANTMVGSVSALAAFYGSLRAWRAHQSAAAKPGAGSSADGKISPELLVLSGKRQMGVGLQARF